MDAQLTYVERLLIRFICVLAFVVVGFAHKVPTLVDGSAQTEFSQYILPDGTLPTLCITSADEHAHGGDNSSHNHATAPDCEACRLAASVMLPQQADVIGQPARFHSNANHNVVRETPTKPLFPPNTGPRAPPVSLTDIG